MNGCIGIILTIAGIYLAITGEGSCLTAAGIGLAIGGLSCMGVPTKKKEPGESEDLAVKPNHLSAEVAAAATEVAALSAQAAALRAEITSVSAEVKAQASAEIVPAEDHDKKIDEQGTKKKNIHRA